ncbi:MAG: hypothetical protein ACI8ZM_002379 [Crocinitomix sp.]|jgi:hypothetical protein
MRALLLILVFIGSFEVSLGQDEIKIEVEINIRKYENEHTSSQLYQIKFYTPTDTFHLETNAEGVLKLSNREGHGIIEVNQDYHYEVFKNERRFGQDNFSTHVTSNTRIIRDIQEFRGCSRMRYDPISFVENTFEFTPKGKMDYQYLSILIHDEENIELEIIGHYTTSSSPETALKRSQIVRDSLIAEGIFPDRLKLGKPQLTDTSNKVGYVILSFDYFPCTGGSVVNFNKTTDTIVETHCDSIQFIANYIQLQQLNYAIIGIYTSKNNRVDKQKALERAALVCEKLIALGVDEKRIRASTSYHQLPGPDDHHDWPFYPESFTYEIGVYVLGDY